MVHFLNRSIKSALVIFGIMTSSTVIIAVFPKFVIECLLQLEFIPSYKILVQHWGLLIFMTGVMLCMSAYRTEWRNPIIIFAVSEKFFFVLLYIGNQESLHIDGLLIAAVFDLFMVSYFVLHLLAKGHAENSRRGSQ